MLAYIALGANLGDPQEAFKKAMRSIEALPETSVIGVSSSYSTEPIDSSGPDYTNAVCAVQTELEPLHLLHELQKIEREGGRIRPAGIRNAPRTLDLDLILYGDRIIEEPELIVPHPRAHERAFVLCPLAEIAPGINIPGKGNINEFLPMVANQRIKKLKELT